MTAPKTILVVDDEAPIRRIIEHKLTRAGYRVVTATNGAEGLERFATERPDVLISDIMMPILDGQTLCRTTNATKAERPFLTIMLTCRISPTEQEWIGEMKDTVFLEKPFSPSVLLDRVDEYLGTER